MTAKDIDISRQIALVGIRVERAIGRLEKFTILNNTIPITQVDLTNSIMVSIGGIIDMNASVVKKSLNTIVINITSSFLYCTIYILTQKEHKTITITIKVFNIRDVAMAPKTSKMESFAAIVNS